jgi:4-cresol dehydrogenase (hydroxylating) flavoprotein subunit
METSAAFLGEIAQELGGQAVNLSEEARRRYGENTMPAGDRAVVGIVYPGSTAEVQTVVRLANKHRVPLWPISTGNNQGGGTRSPVRDGWVTVDCGRRMNRIVEIDDVLCWAEVEPGVTYQRLYDELVRRGNKLMLDTTSGPPEGGVLGNTLEKGAGYTPYFDHFAMSCGMEVVLGNGDVIRTGDGGLPDAKLWHVSKYSYGPYLDGLFVQSNFGIVTRLGFWLMPKPPAIRSFHFSFPDDDDLEQIVELVRPLKMANLVPTLFRLANDLYLFGTEETSPDYPRNGGRHSVSDATRKDLQRKHKIGSWVASGAVYGASDEALQGTVERIRQHFLRSGKASYIPHEQAMEMPPLRIAIDAFLGIPTTRELGMLKWRPGGGFTWFVPGVPMRGDLARHYHAIGRRIYAEHGLDYCVMNIAGARFARGLHMIYFDRNDEEQRERADRCYRQLALEFSKAGYSVGRAPIDYHDLHMGELDPLIRKTAVSLKSALDPNGIIAPGKYGIG